MNKIDVTILSKDIEEKLMSLDNCTGNKFDLHYSDVDMESVTDWLALWDYNEDNEFLIAGNKVKFFIDEKLFTTEDHRQNYLKWRVKYNG